MTQTKADGRGKTVTTRRRPHWTADASWFFHEAEVSKATFESAGFLPDHDFRQEKKLLTL